MVIALITDFGTEDYFVGAMKGVILSINKNANVIDITHGISPQNILSAGFTLSACYKDFPRKTIFVAVVDPGVGSARRAILVETSEYYFIAPDNGLLSFVFKTDGPNRVFELTNEEYFNKPVSKTFHGRDIFSPAAAYLSSGIESQELGVEINDYICLTQSLPKRLGDDLMEAEIIHIDHFGNLITNLTKKDLPDQFELEINGRQIKKLHEYFSESKEGETFMIFGSAGFLEISILEDSAKKILKYEVGQKILVKT